MQHIKQHNDHSCLIASITMITDGVSYRSIKNYCRKHFKYNRTQSEGCHIEHDSLIKYLKSLGHSVLPHKTKSGKISALCKDRKSLIFLSSANGYGHAIVWDGCRIFDPHHNQPYNENALFKIYDMSTTDVTIIIIDEPLSKRLINRFKLYYYKMVEKYEKIISIR